MRAITIILLVILLLLQYPLWLGKGGWLKVWDLHRQVAEQQQVNQQTQARNALLDAEVRDLKQGTEAIEERARSELGMIKRDEVFYQILDSAGVPKTEQPTLSTLAVATTHK
jgi:cell division protein FtsB